MSTESSILAACVASRDAFETLQMHCRRNEFSPIGQHWAQEIGKYYARDKEAQSIERDVIRSLGLKSVGDQHKEIMGEFFDDLPLIGISPENVVADILTHKKNQLGLKLAASLTNPEADTSDIRQQLEDYEDLLVASERGLSRLNVLDPNSVDEVYDPARIIPLYPKQLSAQLLGGGASPGHHILIYGRPEAGKSLFSINMAAGCAYHGKRVLYFGNEEPTAMHHIRLSCNLARVPIARFQEHSEAVKERAAKRGANNVTFVDLDPGTFAEIEQGIKEYKPDVVFIDQLAGIDVRESNPVQAVDRAARNFRTLIKRYDIVGVSVAQAGDRTEKHGQLPPAFLGMGDVYGSRTGLPAQVDLMIGIGFDEDMNSRDLRAVSLPKNKLGGSHSGFKVRINKQQSRVESLV